MYSSINTKECQNKIKELRAKTFNEMKGLKEKLYNFTNSRREKTIHAINDYDDYDTKLSLCKNENENSLKINKDILSKLEIEKSLLNSTIVSKENEINEMEQLVLQKLPAEFSNFDFLFKKELEIHSKMKVENNFLYSKNETLSEELKSMIKIYKDVANIELEKTKEGYLKIIFFKNINSKFPDGASLIVEIKEGSFKIISLFPQINISHFEEELKTSHNFSLFITKLANEFLKYFK